MCRVQFCLNDTKCEDKITEEIYKSCRDDWTVCQLWKAFESDFRDKVIMEEQMKHDDETTAF